MGEIRKQKREFRKNNTGKSKRHTMHCIIIFTVLIIFTTCFFWLNGVYKKVVTPTGILLKAKDYRELVSKDLYATPFHPFLQPVHIFRNEIFWGTGTQIQLDNYTLVITAEHLFQEKSGDAYYFFQKLYGAKDSISIAGIGKIDNGYKIKEGKDIVFCIPGTKKLIECRSAVDSGWWAFPYTLFKTNKYFRSLVTGKSYESFGAIINKEGILQMFFLLYPSVGGESGTGFLDENNQLAVLTNSCPIELFQSMKDDFKSRIPSGFPIVSVLVPFAVEKL